MFLTILGKMRYQSHFASTQPLQCSGLECAPITILSKYRINDDDSNGILDGTVESVSRLLQDLVLLAGQEDARHALPVLELQLGEVFTITSLINVDGLAYLSITAILPKLRALEFLPQVTLHSLTPTTLACDGELLWHADQGRYVLVRQIALSSLADEPAVMDAIMDSSDQAAAWHAQLCAHLHSE